MFNSPAAGVSGSGEPRASSSLSSPNVMTRRVLGTPLRKRRRGSGGEEGRFSGEGTAGACASYESAQELSQRFDRRKKVSRHCEKDVAMLYCMVRR